MMMMKPAIKNVRLYHRQFIKSRARRVNEFAMTFVLRLKKKVFFSLQFLSQRELRIWKLCDDAQVQNPLRSLFPFMSNVPARSYFHSIVYFNVKNLSLEVQKTLLGSFIRANENDEELPQDAEPFSTFMMCLAGVFVYPRRVLIAKSRESARRKTPDIFHKIHPMLTVKMRKKHESFSRFLRFLHFGSRRRVIINTSFLFTHPPPNSSSESRKEARKIISKTSLMRNAGCFITSSRYTLSWLKKIESFGWAGQAWMEWAWTRDENENENPLKMSRKSLVSSSYRRQFSSNFHQQLDEIRSEKKVK